MPQSDSRFSNANLVDRPRRFTLLTFGRPHPIRLFGKLAFFSHPALSIPLNWIRIPGLVSRRWQGEALREYPEHYEIELAIMDKTYMAKPGEVPQNWYVVDGTEKVVGRLASDIAMILMGKNKPTYTPHVDTGDYVIVTNVDKVVFTGKKWDQKRYTWYTKWPGLRSETAKVRMEKKPELILTEAVRRMLPKNKLAKKMLAKLKVYKSGEQHLHQAQQPEPLELAVK